MGVIPVTGQVLAHWLPGPARQSIIEFVEGSAQLPVEERVAVFDNDGTL
jgi:hypothetical protein